jgi:hypothetical protein
MSRNLDSAFLAALESGLWSPVILAALTFKSSTQYVWTGVGDLVYDAQTYLGIGSLGKVGVITEGVEVKADGTTVSLSGIDPVLLNDCLTDIQPGAPATLWIGAMASGALLGAPYKLFGGTMDAPTVEPGAETMTITIALENKMLDLSRPSARRYTSADQRLYFPNDIGFGWVEQLSDLALVWGS